jgi:hypothetical protein
MTAKDPPAGDERARAARRAALVAELAEANRPLVPTMSEAHFQAMIERMADHQLLYEEYGRQGQ